MAIVIKEIQTPSVKIYNPDGTLLCETNNELVFNDIRIQIKDQKLNGYYLIFEGNKCDIDNDGQVIKWPRGLFSISTDQLNYLFGI